MTVIERTYTFEDMRLLSMFARLEGAPAAVEEIIGHLEAAGKLSPAADAQGAVEALERIARGHDGQGRGTLLDSSRRLSRADMMRIASATLGGQ